MSLTGTQIFTYILCIMLPYLGDVKCLKDVIALEKFSRAKMQVLIKWMYCICCTDIEECCWVKVIL